MSDSPGDFLPRRGFLCAQHFGQIVENEDVAGVGPAGSQGTHGDRQVQHASRSDRLNLPGDHAHAQGPAHQIVHDASSIPSEKAFKGMRVRTAGAEHPRNGGIHAENGARRVERNNARGNVF
jgi:hypothetical protein